MKYVIFSFLALLLCCQLTIDDNVNNCMPTEINLHKQQLTKISDEILVNRPVLEKITVFDQIIIDSNYLKKITILSEKWCPEIYQEKEFLRFALIYINCVKYHQYQCCVPPVLEIVSESIFEFDKKKNKTVFDKVMYCLLNKEGITKRNISLNGYTHLDLNFPKTVSLFKEDKELNRFLSEIDKIKKSINWELDN